MGSGLDGFAKVIEGAVIEVFLSFLKSLNYSFTRSGSVDPVLKIRILLRYSCVILSKQNCCNAVSPALKCVSIYLLAL